MDTTKPRYVCPKCGGFEYCEKSNGMPRYPERTIKVMQKWHKPKCDGVPQYSAGSGPESRRVEAMTRLLLIMSLTSCGAVSSFVGQFACENAYVDPRYEGYRYTDYEVRPNASTPGGIQVDTSGFDVDLPGLDRDMEELGRCLGKEVRSCGLVVKVAPDWFWYAGEQVFPCSAGKCMGVIQWPNVMVLTPNWKAAKHEGVHLVAHAAHGDPAFRCASGGVFTPVD